jgi:hypothetical protein
VIEVMSSIYVIAFLVFVWHAQKDTAKRNGAMLFLAWGPFFPMTCILIAAIIGWAAITSTWKWLWREC